MKAFVDKNRCIFCGMCGGICPDVFRADFDNKAIALDVELIGELLSLARYAEKVCPVVAISIQESP